MSEISVYDIVPTPKLADKLIGTSVGGVIEDVTYNFTLQELLQLFIPNIPANTLQGVLDYGNTATQNINLTGTISTTNLTVLATANILNSNLSGNTRVMAGLFDRTNSSGTAGQVLRSTGTQVEWYTVPTVIPTLQQVLQSGNTSNISIVLTANITAVTATADTVVSNTSLNVNGVLKDGTAAAGASNQILSSTGSGVRWVDLPAYNVISPLLYNNATKTFSIQVANSTQNGYLSSADWINFDGKQDAIILTTTGTSGASTLVGNTLNIPVYTPDLSGYVPVSRTLTINGITYDLSANRTWTIAAGVSEVTATSPLFSSGGAEPDISIQVANGGQDGYLSAADWNTFNNKQNALSGGTGLVKSTAGVITYITDNSTNWNTAYNESIVSAEVTGTATKTLTLNQQDGGTITASWSDIDTGLTSVGLSMPSAFTVTNSPLTSNGTIGVTGAGTTAQYVRGDGSLATFPTIASEAQRLVTEVYNSTGATLTKGTVVYVNGGQGNLPTITKAIATGDSTSAQTYGVVQNDITNMNNGYVVVIGSLQNIDTQAYTNGTQLYLSSTVAGAWTSVKQYAPAHLVYVGIVIRSHPTQGVVEIRIQNGFEMDELHNVAAQNPDNNAILQYKTATSLWTSVDGTTTNIAEGTNLYYLDSRARAALSFVAGSGAYNNTTGVITIPTNTNQLTNGASFITLSSLTASSPLSYNNTTGDFSISQAGTSANGYLSSVDWNTFNNKQVAGDYITSLTGEATGTGPGATAVTLNNASVTGKVLTGVNITGGTVLATDTMLTAFGKLQNQINGLIGSTIYQGVWNANTNTPTLASSVGTRGYYYIVNVAGNTNLNGITDWQVGDWAIFDGTAWQKVDNTDAVTSVNGFTGAVSLTTDNIAEGTTNLYFANSLARTAVSLTTTGSSGVATYNNTTGVFNIPNYGTALADYLPLTGGTLTGGLVINPANTGVIGLDVASDTVRLRSDSTQPFPRQLTTTMGSGTLVKMQAAGYGAVYVTDLGFYTSTSSAVNTTPNLYLTGGNNRVGINTATPAYTLDVVGTAAVSGVLLVNSPSEGATGEGLIAGQSFKIDATGASQRAQMYVVSNVLSNTYGSGLQAQYANFAGDKAFGFNLNTSGGFELYVKNTSFNKALTIANTGAATFENSVTASSLIKSGGTAAQFLKADGSVDSTAYGTGTVTSVAALTLGTTGTDLSSSVATGTTTPVITLNVPTASATNRGALSAADWTTFNSKQNALTNPITGTGTTNTIPKFTGASTLGNSIITEGTGFITVSGAAVDNAVASFFNTDAGSHGIYVRADGFAFKCEPISLVGGVTINSDGSASFSGDITANKFIKSGGTASQFLMADGSVSSGPSGGITGSGTTNTLPKFTGASTIGNSAITDDGTTVTLVSRALNGTSASFSGLTVENNQNGSTWIISKNTNSGAGAAAGFLMTNNTGDLGAISLLSSGNSPSNGLFIRTLSTNSLILGTNSTANLTIASGGAATFTNTVTAPTFIGALSGNAISSTSTTFVASPDGGRNPNTAPLPTTNPRSLSYNFADRVYVTGATGNYAGVMTYAPWDGTSASTGDSSYQLAFCNWSGVNASGLPGLAIRNGINSSWNATWYQLLHSGNFNSYALPLTGGTLSGALIVSPQLTVNTGGTGTWGPFVVTSTSQWGDGATQYVTIGAGGAAGIMINNPHIVWNASEASAAAKFGRSGGVSTGSYYVAGTGPSNNFFINKDGGSNLFNINSSGNATFSGTISASNLSGTNTGDSSSVANRSQSNWNDSTVINNVVGMLAWKNYGNGHVIFDASQSTSPSGTAVNAANATYAWTSSFPTLMGWNGGSTYGVRVDSARVSDNISSYTINQDLGTGNSPTFLNQVLSGRLNFGTNGVTPYLDATGLSCGISFGGWESSSLRQYGVFTELENVGGNYAKLTFNWHTGIRLGASPSYGGTRFYNDAAGNGSSSMIFSVGNGDSNVRVVNSLFIGGNTAWHAGNAPRAGNSNLVYYAGFTLDANAMPMNSNGFTYSQNAPYTGPIENIGDGGYALQLNAAYGGGGTQIAFRTRNGDSGTFNAWRNLLNDANYTNWAIARGGDTVTGLIYFKSNRNTSTDSAPLQAYSDNGSGAIMSFHRGGYYAVNFGLDSDNVMRIGGWSAAVNRWQLDMSGNQTVAGSSTATSFFESSDSRLKTLIDESGQVLGIENLEAKLYEKNGKIEFGYFAQDAQKLMPYAVTENSEGFLNLSYREVHTAKIARLEKEIEELKAKLN